MTDTIFNTQRVTGIFAIIIKNANGMEEALREMQALATPETGMRDGVRDSINAVCKELNSLVETLGMGDKKLGMLPVGASSDDVTHTIDDAIARNIKVREYCETSIQPYTNANKGEPHEEKTVPSTAGLKEGTLHRRVQEAKPIAAFMSVTRL
jgi:hypothetical protein